MTGKAKNALQKCDKFLGLEFYLIEQPRTGIFNTDRILSANGKEDMLQ